MTTIPALPFDPETTLLTLGLLYMLMPLTVWTVLANRHDLRSVSLWCGGALLSGGAFVLIGLRDSVPPPLSLEIANAVGYAGIAMRWAALRRERGAPVSLVGLAVAVLVASLLYSYIASISAQVRLAFNLAVLITTSTATAAEALHLARLNASRSARMVGITYLIQSGALLLREVSVLSGLGGPSVAGFGIDFALVLLTGMLTALWGNLGYLGFAMETMSRREAARTAELASATARREQAERQAVAMKALSDEREELLRVISHEARQPLHNAQAVLQGVDSVLHTGLAAGEAAARIVRARSVLRQITASLDNTLAVSTLLVEGRATALRDADIDMLIELALGDLPPREVARVVVQRDTDVRTAAMDVGLMRLALRNLLNNALAYATPGSPVTLRIADSDEPLALLIEVADVGPGIAPDLLPRVFERGTRGRVDLHGQGLGLFIVRHAMRRQGGDVEVRSAPSGTVFTLTVPQGIEPV